jgi:preprotein translocase subunit SecD
MRKRSRLFLILAVLVLCFVFLWPSITWYALTPKEVQSMALSSLEKIKDYSIYTANEEVNTLFALARKDSALSVESKYDYLVKLATKNYKAAGKSIPKTFTIGELLSGFSSKAALTSALESYYREEILKAKKAYNNSVKLGLDLSGGMNVIVRADLDAAVAEQGDELAAENVEAFKKEAMENAIENLSSRVDRFGLSSPVIRQQGDDRIYIEIPGAAQADTINTLIMGKGVLNFRLADMAATDSFKAYYAQNPASTFNAAGELMDKSIIPEDCEVFGVYTNIIRIFFWQ